MNENKIKSKTTSIEGAMRTSKYIDPQTGKRLSGVAVRKLKKEAARQGGAEARGHKRPRDTHTTPTSAEKLKVSKRPREHTQTSHTSFSDALTGIKVAIINIGAH